MKKKGIRHRAFLLARAAVLSGAALLAVSSAVPAVAAQDGGVSVPVLLKGFLNPPDSVRPGVYWYFMDGNLSREAMTADLESMKDAGSATLSFLR